MDLETYKKAESILVKYCRAPCADALDAKECKIDLNNLGITMNLKTDWIHNKAIVEYKGETHIIEV